MLLAIFYAVTFNIYKYHTSLDVQFIYGDVNNNGEMYDSKHQSELADSCSVILADVFAENILLKVL